MGRLSVALRSAGDWLLFAAFAALLLSTGVARAQVSDAADDRAPTETAATAPSAASLAPTNRTPMLVAFGVGAVATGGAVMTGIFANSEYQSAKSDCSPRCSDADVSAGRALALTSTVFTGLAVVGVGVGITLLLLEEPSSSQADTLSLSLAPTVDGARAGALWRF